jgi:hypothetical protein
MTETQQQARARITRETRDLAARLDPEARTEFRRELEAAIAGADDHRAGMIAQTVRRRRREGNDRPH